MRRIFACLALIGCAKDATPTAATTATSAATAIATTSTTAAATPTATEVTVGRPPPALKAKAHDGTALDLAALKGKHVVVYFYPKDETPGCTKEACAFRDAWNELKKRGVVLIGVSGDSDESHRAFAEHHKLPFLLVSDATGDLARAFSVPFSAGFAGRQSFVVGPDGNVKKIYRKVDVAAHAAEILEDTK